MKKPKILCRASGMAKSENYFAAYKPGLIEVTGEGTLGTESGLAQLSWAAEAGHWSEFLGKITPRFPLRPLWVKNSITQDPAQVASRIAELGYNALITSDSSKALAAALAAKGIIYILHSQEGTLPEWVESIFYRSQALDPNRSRTSDLTDAESVIQELQTIEQKMTGRGRLIFFVDQGDWFIDLCQAAGPKTTIAFSAVHGDWMLDHLNPNPCWSALRQERLPVTTALLPILNLGGVGQGGGMWPVVPFDLYDDYFPRLKRHHFLGAIAATTTIPPGPGFLECNLWVGSQLLWHIHSAEMLLETWFKARANVDYVQIRPWLKEIRAIALEINKLKYGSEKLRKEWQRSEAISQKIELLLGRLKLLDHEIRETAHRHLLSDSFPYFFLDQGRLLQLIAQRLDLHLRGGLTQEQLNLDSFWTGSGKGGAAAHKVAQYESPYVNPEDPRMQQIYNLNFTV